MKAKDILAQEDKNKSFSHAYLFVGKNDEEISKLIDYIIEKKSFLKEDISVLDQKLDQIGKSSEIKVDDVRNLLHLGHLSPHGNSRLIIIKNCEKLNQSSGNILLKILEEPPKHLTIILTSQTRSVLATIKSLCRVINVNSRKSETSDIEKINNFLNLSFFDASKKIEEIIKKNEVESFLDDLINFFEEKLLNEKSKKIVVLLEKILQTKKEISGNANSKLALECLFLKLRKSKPNNI